MYAVIRTGGKQYKVQAGDLLVVEKLEGDAGANISFGDVLMLGDGSDITVGAPLIDGASVVGTLIETRKGEKVKVFKKIRRQGYRRTGGHRQLESVIRVTEVAGGGKSSKWDGTVDLTPKALLDAKARNLTNVVKALQGADAAAAFQDAPAAAPISAQAVEAAPAPPEAAPALDGVQPDVTAAPEAAAEPKAKAAPKKAAAPKAKKTEEE